jgi:hypothetical protein
LKIPFLISRNPGERLLSEEYTLGIPLLYLFLDLPETLSHGRMERVIGKDESFSTGMTCLILVMIS